jgi:hypothetical protein
MKDITQRAQRRHRGQQLRIDQKESKKDGRHTLFATPDFFVDRNVKAMEKIEIVKSDSLR